MNPEHNPQYPANDEIDLFELVEKLWQQKWLIALVTALCTALAVIYAVLATPVYKTSAELTSPLSSDIAPLNQGRSLVGLPELSSDDVYGMFHRNLTSGSARLWFFNEYYGPYRQEQGSAGARDSMLSALRSTLQVSQPDAKNNPSIWQVAVTLEGEPERAAQWVGHYLAWAADRTRQDLAINTEREIDNRLASIEGSVSALRKSAQGQREDRIVRLQEALIIADAVGYEAPQVIVGKTMADSELAQMIDGSLLYMRGAKAIRSELKLLEERENDDPFIGELRTLQMQRDLLQSFNTHPEEVGVFTLDSAAEVPELPIKPKKALIVALGLVLGGILGGGIALVRIAVGSRRQGQVRT